MKAMVLLLGLAAFPAMAADLSGETNASLCTAQDVVLMGYRLPASADEIAAELIKRDEACQPPDVYLEMAKQWIANMRGRTQVQAPPEPTWGDRIGRAANAYLRMQQEQHDRAWANRPTVTNCIPTAVGVQCTTN